MHSQVLSPAFLAGPCLMRPGDQITAPEIYAYLSRVLYNKRSKMNPYWTSLIVGGVTEGKTFLGTLSCRPTDVEATS